MKQLQKVFLQSLNNAMTELSAYRSALILNFVLGFGWAFVQLLTVEILYTHTTSFAGWSKSDVILLLVTFSLSTEFLSTFATGIDDLERLIRKGDFDYVVTKPIDSQFLVMFRRPDLLSLFYFFTYILPYLYLLLQNPPEISITRIAAYIYLLLCGNILWISLKTLAMTVNFWHQNLQNISYLLYSMLSIGKYPTSMFPPQFRILLYTVLPIAFIGVVPTQVLQGKVGYSLVVAMTFVTALAVFFARTLWKKAVNSYSSASS